MYSINCICCSFVLSSAGVYGNGNSPANLLSLYAYVILKLVESFDGYACPIFETARYS
jgi:hypothetical protein